MTKEILPAPHHLLQPSKKPDTPSYIPINAAQATNSPASPAPLIVCIELAPPVETGGADSVGDPEAAPVAASLSASPLPALPALFSASAPSALVPSALLPSASVPAPPSAGPLPSAGAFPAPASSPVSAPSPAPASAFSPASAESSPGAPAPGGTAPLSASSAAAL